MEKIKGLFWVCVLCWASVSAAFQDHLKEAKDKGEGHSMPGIDFIYGINLDERPEKWAKTIAQLKPYGIVPYRFSAVNGWKLGLEVLNDVGVKYTQEMDGQFLATSFLTPDLEGTHRLLGEEGQTYFCHCFRPGTVGIAMSHLSVLKDALDSGYETIWVIEDDIEVIRDPRVLSEYLKILSHKVGEWDVLFTDRDMRGHEGQYVPCFGAARRPNFTPPQPAVYKMRKNVGPHFRKIGARFGAHSMIIRRSGVQKIYDYMVQHQIYLPYDMDMYMVPGIRLYTVRRDVVSNLITHVSDNGQPNYEKNSR